MTDNWHHLDVVDDRELPLMMLLWQHGYVLLQIVAIVVAAE